MDIEQKRHWSYYAHLFTELLFFLIVLLLFASAVVLAEIGLMEAHWVFVLTGTVLMIDIVAATSDNFILALFNRMGLFKDVVPLTEKKAKLLSSKKLWGEQE